MEVEKSGGLPEKPALLRAAKCRVRSAGSLDPSKPPPRDLNFPDTNRYGPARLPIRLWKVVAASQALLSNVADRLNSMRVHLFRIDGVFPTRILANIAHHIFYPSGLCPNHRCGVRHADTADNHLPLLSGIAAIELNDAFVVSPAPSIRWSQPRRWRKPVRG